MISNSACIKKSTLKLFFVFTIVILGYSGLSHKKAHAACSCALPPFHVAAIAASVSTIQGLTSSAMSSIESFLLGTFWPQAVFPQLKAIGLELSANIYSTIPMVAGFLDAQTQQEAMLRMQRLSAQTTKKYIPSVSVCEFATLSKSLGAAESAKNETARYLSLPHLKRLTLHEDFAGSESPFDDYKGRLELFKQKYCLDLTDSQDMSGALEGLCTATAPNPTVATATSPPRTTSTAALTTARKRNKDINFSQTLGQPRTVFLATNATAPTDESLSQLEDVITLSRYLYGTSNIRPLPPTSITPEMTDLEHFRLVEQRSDLAKKAVAQNSFAHYVAAKAATDKEDGSELNIKRYAEELLGTELGVPNSEFEDYWTQATAQLSETTPSYWAQMEFITKKLYQNPRFYANLYHNPANVKRQSAAMKSIELMQERDIYESALRSELLMSLWLETEINEYGKPILQKWANIKASR